MEKGIGDGDSWSLNLKLIERVVNHINNVLEDKEDFKRNGPHTIDGKLDDDDDHILGLHGADSVVPSALEQHLHYKIGRSKLVVAVAKPNIGKG